MKLVINQAKEKWQWKNLLMIWKTLQIIQFRVDDPEEEAKKVAEQLETERKIEEAVRQFNLSNDGEGQGSKKVSRNDPCPCGSGKKYKQCCGKSGPKKGMFASWIHQ